VAVQRLELEPPALREVVVERGVGFGRQTVGRLHDAVDEVVAEIDAAGRRQRAQLLDDARYISRLSGTARMTPIGARASAVMPAWR